MVPVNLLNKTARLTNIEFNLIKKHTILGYGLLDNVDIDKEVRQVALLHHERIDGSGYPFNIKSNRVGVYTRIVAVADVFDAMTSDRTYKKRVTPFDTFRMFKTIGTRLFDTTIVNSFVNNISAFYTGMKVALNTGETGQIVYIPPHDIANPVILVNQDYIDLAHKRNLRIVNML